MKRVLYVWLAATILAGVSVPYSGAQNAGASTLDTQEPSLGSYARAVRKDKKQEAAKQFDNDNLPRDNKLSVVGNELPAADSQATPRDATQAAATAAPENQKMTPGQSMEERQKVIDAWQKKLSEQHAQVDALSQALELREREYRVHAAEYYNDPSQRISDAQWGKDDAEYKQKIAEERKAVEDAKQKFGDLEEEARHSGVPSSVSEAVEQQPETAPQEAETAPQPAETAPQPAETAPQPAETAPQQEEASPEEP